MSISWRGNSTAFRYNLEPGDICVHCKTQVFNSKAYQSLLSARPQDTVNANYTKQCSEIYASFLIKCPWCSAIAQAIRFNAELVTFMNSDDDDADQTYGEYPIANLDCEAIVDVIVSFCRSQGGEAINSCNIQIEVINPDTKASGLPEMKGADSTFLKFEISSNDSPFFQPHWGRISADSSAWVAPALNWMQTCNSHPHCKPAGGFCPTRLINVADPDNPRVELREEIILGTGFHYATLSYVWGHVHPYVLEVANLQDLRKGLDITKLSKTILDAMRVAAQLGMNYIWIDALCIVQNSPEDMSEELPQMANIYRSSALTVFAASSNSQDNGFLNPPSGLHNIYPPVTIPIDTGIDGQQCSFLMGKPSDPSRNDNPIYSRAWTLQEQLLSHRLLVFEMGGVSWQCSEQHMTYRGPASHDEQPFLSLCRAGSDADVAAIYQRWLEIRSDYCGRSMFVLSDKLNAISAAASEISRSKGWTYLAGLWSECLVNDLLWTYTNPKAPWQRDENDYPILTSQRARAAARVAPSWSWASVAEGGILDTQASDDRAPFEFELLDSGVQVADDGPFGSVTAGFLLVKGKVISLRFRREYRPEMLDMADIALLGDARDGDGQGQGDGVGDEVVGYGVTDPLDQPLQLNESVTYLAVASQLIFENEAVEGLMLSSDGHGNFRRIGFFRIHRGHIFDSVPRRVLRVE
ncbi:hypothetical protein V496_07254 [Pseudogymnoascus sp. VKM F-4515 (FW-2607)]|nr:hypothetical protein V496_07254 [Pseudogymnoascus sp. VKM F-4515 (FW-2607)]